MVTWANRLGLDEVAELLAENRDEEESTNELLSEIAETGGTPKPTDAKARSGVSFPTRAGSVSLFWKGVLGHQDACCIDCLE